MFHLTFNIGTDTQEANSWFHPSLRDFMDSSSIWHWFSKAPESGTMNRKNQLLVKDRPVEFEKKNG